MSAEIQAQSLIVKIIIFIILLIVSYYVYNKYFNYTIRDYECADCTCKNEDEDEDGIGVPHPISEPFETSQQIVWVYWENTIPTYVQLCLDTIKKHLSKYDLRMINSQSIIDYLPDIINSPYDFTKMKIAQKVDYYRLELLVKYGGVWIDADIIMLSNIDLIFDKLNTYDYVGFGCTGFECSYGYGRPSNWVMGSKKNGILVSRALEIVKKKLETNANTLTHNVNTDYHDFGKYVLWEALDQLEKETQYLSKGKYYHFTSEYDGTRDRNKQWIHVDNFFSNKPTEFLNGKKLMFVVLYNSEIRDVDEYRWAVDCSKEELLGKDIWMSQLFRKGLGLEMQ